MAGNYIRHVVLNDKVPGFVNPNLSIPKDGFDGTTYSACVTTAVYPLGTKIAVYNDATNWPGWSTLVYGWYQDGSDGPTSSQEISTGYGVCSHACSCESMADGTYHGPYRYTTDITNSDLTRGGPAVIPVHALSTCTYGWFWCGGVCPNVCITRWQGDTGYLANEHGQAATPGQQVIFLDDGTSGSQLERADITGLEDGTDCEVRKFDNLAHGWILKVQA